MKDCPQKRRDATRPIAKRRVFHLDESNTVLTPVVIQVMLSIHDSIACALIDTSTTHFFISCRFARNLLGKLDHLEQALIVKTPSKSVLKAHVMYKSKLAVDLIL